MPAAVCFLASVVISSHLACYITSAQKGQTCLLISPFRFMKNVESSFHPRERKAWWVVHCSVMPEKHFALSNCPAPNVSVDLKLPRGNCCFQAPQWAHKPGFCKAFLIWAQQGLCYEAEPLLFSSFLDHHVCLVCMTLQKKLLCCMLGQAITTVECVRVTPHESYMKSGWKHPKALWEKCFFSLMAVRMKNTCRLMVGNKGCKCGKTVRLKMT